MTTNDKLRFQFKNEGVFVSSCLSGKNFKNIPNISIVCPNFGPVSAQFLAVIGALFRSFRSLMLKNPCNLRSPA
jgi:hypothetical protein